jgi:hypothetical protein
MYIVSAIPSTPVTPIPSMIFWVRRNGTFSGVSSVLPCTASSEAGINEKRIADLFEETIEVNMDDVTGVDIKENIFTMSVAQSVTVFVKTEWIDDGVYIPKNESHHRHNGRRPPISQSTGEPC